MHSNYIQCICHILILNIFKTHKIISNTIIDTQITSTNTLTSIYIHHGQYELI